MQGKSAAGPMLPDEEPRDTGALQSTKGQGEGDLPRFHPMLPMDPRPIAKNIRPAEFRAWTSKFLAFIKVSTRGTPTREIFVNTFMSKTDHWWFNCLNPHVTRETELRDLVTLLHRR